jgi:hypothetical protein
MSTNMKTLAVLCLLAVLAPCAYAQACERTFTLSGHYVPEGLKADHIVAQVGRHRLPVTRLEPIRSSRILIFIEAEYRKLAKNRLLKKLTANLASLDSIPANMKLAYAVKYEKTIAFSGPFTSDPQALHDGLQKLILDAAVRQKAKGMDEALDWFGEPQPGDAVIQVAFGYAVEYPNVERFLQNGIRLFNFTFDRNPYRDCLDFPDCTTTIRDLSEKLGGNQWRHPDEEENEQASWEQARLFWFEEIPRGYMVTVAVPHESRVPEKGWMVAVSKSAQDLLGTTILNNGSDCTQSLADYPDLMLCNTKAKLKLIYRSRDGQSDCRWMKELLQVP